MDLLLRMMLAVCTPAVAQDAPPQPGPLEEARLQAEHRRLSGELRSLARRQAWAGVQRTYLELEALGLPLSYEDHVAGAEAARALGEMAQAYARFSAAARLEGTREVVEWLWAVDQSYGRVQLRTVPPQAPNTLTPAGMPMLPEPRLCVETAQARVAGTGAFDGMLPAGTYTFGDQVFEVVPGPTPQVVTAQAPAGARTRRGR